MDLARLFWYPPRRIGGSRSSGSVDAMTRARRAACDENPHGTHPRAAKSIGITVTVADASLSPLAAAATIRMTSPGGRGPTPAGIHASAERAEHALPARWLGVP